jgi:hypothetical protein
MTTKLMTAFNYAVSAFNSGDYSTSFKPLLHKHVVMNQVDDPKAPPHAGIDNVIHYLVRTQSTLLPQFGYVPDPNDPLIYGPKEAPEDTDGAAAQVLHAQINGIGTYQDVKNDPKTLTHVRYFFLFRRESPGASWLLVHAVATPYKP